MNPRAKEMHSTLIGKLLFAFGLIAILAPMYLISNYDSMMGPWWNFAHSRVKLSEKMSESFMSAGGFRQKFPMYADLSAAEIATRLHARYFNDMPKEKYEAIFMGAGYKDTELGTGDASRDPLELRAWPYDYKEEDPRLLALATGYAIDQGLYSLKYEETSVPYWCFALIGMLLVAAGIKKTFWPKI